MNNLFKFLSVSTLMCSASFALLAEDVKSPLKNSPEVSSTVDVKDSSIVELKNENKSLFRCAYWSSDIKDELYLKEGETFKSYLIFPMMFSQVTSYNSNQPLVFYKKDKIKKDTYTPCLFIEPMLGENTNCGIFLFKKGQYDILKKSNPDSVWVQESNLSNNLVKITQEYDYYRIPYSMDFKFGSVLVVNLSDFDIKISFAGQEEKEIKSGENSVAYTIKEERSCIDIQGESLVKKDDGAPVWKYSSSFVMYDRYRVIIVVSPVKEDDKVVQTTVSILKDTIK